MLEADEPGTVEAFRERLRRIIAPERPAISESISEPTADVYIPSLD
ncbi:MAG: hypothetical protein M3041_20630 [Acidobacteriota bacterium]|nr:hypothetical protein [Acidobacteriota bacterium]